MKEDPHILKPEDYLEPGCPLCEDPFGTNPRARSIPQQRIIEKLDEHMSRRDLKGAERHLLYWLEEAKLGQDLRGELMLQNELTGHYRKMQNKEAALTHAGRALELVDALGMEDTLSAGTTYVNAATAFHAFGEQEKALLLFEKARQVYGSCSSPEPSLLGGLYNNMALSLAALKRYPQARELYRKAMEEMEKVPGGNLEQAITCINMADTARDEKGPEDAEAEINALMEQAFCLLDRPDTPRDGYYAFVCEKCAPSFSWYGYFLQAEELGRRAEEIYRRNGRRT